MGYPSQIKSGGRVYDVVYKFALKATSSVRIKSGHVEVRLSKLLIGRRRDQTVLKFLNWALKRLARISHDSILDPEYKDGGRILTHNRIYELRISRQNRKNNFVRITDDGLIGVTLGRNENNVKGLVDKAIIKDQTLYLKEVVDELNQLYFQEKVNDVRFKRTLSRFGSCSSKRNINISFRLLFAPRDVFRYVCVHELAHLKEMNHSKRFWKLVEEALPDYKKSEKWLKINGFLLG